jgi:hypothetical protein
MSETETTTIDEKKAEDSGATTDKADWKSFSKVFSSTLVTGIFFGVVVIGSMGLFLAKVANANILPTDCKIQPYPSDKEMENLIKAREVATNIIYMNPIKILPFFGLGFWENLKSDSYFIQEANFVNTKAELNFMDEFNNSWLCSLKNKAYPPKKDVEVSELLPEINAEKSSGLLKPDIDKLPQNSPFWAYEFKTLKAMTCKSFSIINKIFFYMNYLPEWGCMLFFALFFSIILVAIFFINGAYGAWAHFSNFGELIKNLYDPKEFNKGLNGIVNDKLEWYQTWITYPLYIFVYFIGALWSTLLISPALVTFYALFKSLGAEYVVRDKNYKGDPKDAPKQNIFSFIKSALYYKKTFIIILVMLNLMGTTNQYLGTSYLSGVIIAIIILIFGLKILEIGIPEELFPVINSNFPPLSLAKVDLETENKVDICKEEEEVTKTISKEEEVKTTTGFIGPNIFDFNKVGFKGGAKSVRTHEVPTKSKPKTKIYNLKLI